MSINVLKHWMQSNIVGQEHLVDRLLIALLADGHLLVQGPPGLAKTKAIKSLAEGIACDFHRVQFTPDLLPTDITGTDIYLPESHQFEFQPGPIFHNLILADEINRAPAKTQAALLEAMAEQQVSIGSKTYPLPELFLVMATQNPIEQEGTYPLPEAQLDRFLMQVNIDYPDAKTEAKILKLVRNEQNQQQTTVSPEFSVDSIVAARREVLSIHMADSLDEYIVQLTMATRKPENYDIQLSQLITYGVSPRATIALDRCAKAHAFLRGSDFVSPDDIRAVIHDVFRHRILLSFEADANGLSVNEVIDRLLELVPVV